MPFPRASDIFRFLAAKRNTMRLSSNLAERSCALEDEPPEPGEEMTVDEFAALNTRVLPISRETRTINAYGYQRGDIRGMPEYCITIGMRQILSARSIYIALNRDWQHGIARHVFSDPIQPQIPASLLRRNPQVCFCAPQSIGAGL